MIKLVLTNWIIVFLLMTLAWIIYLKLKNPGIIDVFWPITILISGLHYFFYKQQFFSSLIFAVLLFLWAIRLSGYLLTTRILPNIIEKRYAFINKSTDKKTKLHFFIHYQFQGILGMLIAIPFYFIGNNSENTILILITSLIIIFAIIGESLADLQLLHFKKNKLGSVCNIGFWQYSRHPNYFFEWLIWVGFALAGFSYSTGWVGFLSPFLLLFIMLKITIPITENASIKSRGDDYINYQKITPVFFPFKIRKN